MIDLSTNPNTYRSVLKSFLNDEKITCIFPIFHEKRIATDFKEKAEFFNSLFAKQY